MSRKETGRSEIEQIREIVFGPQMVSLESQLRGIEADFCKSFEKISQKVAGDLKKLSDDIAEDQVEQASVIEEIKSNLSLLQRNQEGAERSLRAFFEASLATQKQGFAREIKTLAAELTALRKDSAQFRDALKSEIMESLRMEISTLRKSHLSEADFSRALSELSSLFAQEKKLPLTTPPAQPKMRL